MTQHCFVCVLWHVEAVALLAPQMSTNPFLFTQTIKLLFPVHPTSPSSSTSINPCTAWQAVAVTDSQPTTSTTSKVQRIKFGISQYMEQLQLLEHRVMIVVARSDLLFFVTTTWHTQRIWIVNTSGRHPKTNASVLHSCCVSLLLLLSTSSCGCRCSLRHVRFKSSCPGTAAPVLGVEVLRTTSNTLEAEAASV